MTKRTVDGRRVARHIARALSISVLGLLAGCSIPKPWHRVIESPDGSTVVEFREWEVGTVDYEAKLTITRRGAPAITIEEWRADSGAFYKEHPTQSWIADDVLRFELAEDSPVERRGELVVHNATTSDVGIVDVEVDDTFLFFDLRSGERRTVAVGPLDRPWGDVTGVAVILWNGSHVRLSDYRIFELRDRRGAWIARGSGRFEVRILDDAIEIVSPDVPVCEPCDVRRREGFRSKTKEAADDGQTPHGPLPRP
jgi:hypothetical protein